MGQNPPYFAVGRNIITGFIYKSLWKYLEIMNKNELPKERSLFWIQIVAPESEEYYSHTLFNNYYYYQISKQIGVMTQHWKLFFVCVSDIFLFSFVMVMIKVKGKGKVVPVL
jgi:hypothetical protein